MQGSLRSRRLARSPLGAFSQGVDDGGELGRRDADDGEVTEPEARQQRDVARREVDRVGERYRDADDVGQLTSGVQQVVT